MARPRRNPERLVSTSSARRARLAAIREAGGWSGRVELSPEAHAALKRLQGERSISETIASALLAA